jgi:hypothetical protein
MKILRRHASRRGYFVAMACLTKLGRACPGISRSNAIWGKAGRFAPE